MTRNQPTPQPPLAPSDPLADLRAPDLGPVVPTATLAPPVPPNSEPEPEELTGYIRPMVDQDTWDEMVAETVAAWHADPTSKGFMHGGGQCGCWYLAKIALQVIPVVTDEDLEERELETSGE